jgi:hypothetical protein
MKHRSAANLLMAAGAMAVATSPLHAQQPTGGNGLEILDMKSSSACRGLCLTIDKRPTKVGEPITGSISWNSAKRGSALNVYLSPTVNRVGRTQNVGRYGSLMKHAFTIPTEAGSFRFRWKGSGFWCAPTDFPRICDEPPPADTYRLTATVLDSNVSPMAVLQRGSSTNPIRSPRTLATVSIGPFELR